MSGLDDLRLDADGYLDMSQFDAGDLDAGALDDLRTALLDDPVDEPTDDEWTSLVDRALETDAEFDGALFSDVDVAGDPGAEPTLWTGQVDDTAIDRPDDGSADDPEPDDPSDGTEVDPSDGFGDEGYPDPGAEASYDLDLDGTAYDADAYLVDDVSDDGGSLPDAFEEQL